MNLIAWVLFGLVVGVIANVLDPHPQRGGALGAIILGVIGALVGGFLSTLLFGVGITGFNFTSFAVAVLGSLLLLYLERVFRTA